MKKLVFILMALSFLFLSCEKSSENIKAWGDLNSIPLDLMPPVCAVWYKPGPLGWLPNKCFAQGEEIREIIKLLQDEKESEPPDTLFEGTQKFSLIFYKGVPETLAVREFRFDLNNDTFVWAYGKSQKLGRILIEKESWGRYYQDPTDPNLVRRIKESQERLREEIARLKSEKEAKTQINAEDINRLE